MNKVGNYLRAAPTAMHNHVKPLGTLALVYGITHTVAVLGIKAWIASQTQESKTLFIERHRLQVIDQTSTLRLLSRPLLVAKAFFSLCFPQPLLPDTAPDSQRLSEPSGSSPAPEAPSALPPETATTEALTQQHENTLRIPLPDTAPGFQQLSEPSESSSAPETPSASPPREGSQEALNLLTKTIEVLKRHYEHTPSNPSSKADEDAFQQDLTRLKQVWEQVPKKCIDATLQSLAVTESETFRTLRTQLQTLHPPPDLEKELSYALMGIDICIGRVSFQPPRLRSPWKAIGIALILCGRYPDLDLDLSGLFTAPHPAALNPLTPRALLTAVAQRQEHYEILKCIESREPEEKPSKEILRFLSEFTVDTLPASPCQSASASPSRGDPLVGACVKLLAAAKKATTFDELCSNLRGMLSDLEDTLSLPGLPLLRWALSLNNDNSQKKVSLMTALGLMAYRVSPHVQVPCRIFSKTLPQTVAADELLANTANRAEGYLFLTNVGRKPKDPRLQKALASLEPFKTTAPEPEHRESSASALAAQ